MVLNVRRVFIFFANETYLKTESIHMNHKHLFQFIRFVGKINSKSFSENFLRPLTKPSHLRPKKMPSMTVTKLTKKIIDAIVE